MPASLRRTVPAFSSDGRRLRGYSREAAERLEGLSIVSVRRNRHGVILAIHFRDAAGGSPLRATAQMGQRYSFQAKIGEAHRVWTHADIDVTPEAFARVVLDQTI